MILFPAIDLKDEQCVRLRQGDMEQATVFSVDPGAQGRLFESQGFKWLHLVDLDGAFAGKPVNVLAVAQIVRSVKIPIQLGGGIRNLATIDAWLGEGITRVILGTAAVRDTALVRNACRTFPGRIAVGIDARDGKVAIGGWAETSEMTALDLARSFEDAGVAAIIYTDIARDGVLEGLNLEATRALAEAVSIPVIASGGLASIDDVALLLEPRYAILAGAIAGRALYDGRLNPAEALALVAARQSKTHGQV
ncbi:MAG: 1-(5-phosphoribosyl)-5-[(5-phosphoribosylamino)methylideneamino]imidazole-4-carboxamide isomerase [Methyloceanibacter sp.]